MGAGPVDSRAGKNYIDNHSHLMIIIMTTTESPPATAATPAPGQSPAPEVSSTRLLGNNGQLRIEHKGAVYTLRATSKGGLILTK